MLDRIHVENCGFKVQAFFGFTAGTSLGQQWSLNL